MVFRPHRVAPARRQREAEAPKICGGAIEIADKFSLVELSEGVVERVAAALRQTTIKRKKVVVRIEHPAPRAR